MTKIINVPGIGKINKDDYKVTYRMDDTILLTHMGIVGKPKLWMLEDEWAGKTVDTSRPEPTKRLSEDTQKELEKEFQAAVSNMMEKKADDDMSLEKLQQLYLDELFLLAAMTHGEEKVREKLYSLWGHCPKDKKCKDKCKHGEEDA